MLTSLRRSIANAATTLLVMLTAFACSDQHPTESATPPQSPQAQQSASAIQIDSLGESPLLLAVAREVPEFAGLYFDDQGELVVALTDVARLADAESAIRSHLDTHRTAHGMVDRATARFVARAVEYPFLELARHRELLRQNVFAIPGVVSLGVKESENRIVVGVSDPGTMAQVRDLLPKLGVPAEEMSIQQVPRPVATSHTLASSMGNIQGGWEIGLTIPFGVCTLGFPARRTIDGSPVFVTNSHCTTVQHGFDGDASFQAGIHIGNEILDPNGEPCLFETCRNADAALFSPTVPIQLGSIVRTTASSGCEACVAPLTVDHTNPTFQIVGQSGVIIENVTLHKVGRTTGWTYGGVEDTCSDYSIDGWIRLCSDRVDYSTDHGDSGAPVFSLNADGTVILRGISFGYQGWPYSDALMSNIGQVQKDLGGLLTYDPGPPSVSIIGPTEVLAGAFCRWSVLLHDGMPL